MSKIFLETQAFYQPSRHRLRQERNSNKFSSYQIRWPVRMIVSYLLGSEFPCKVAHIKRKQEALFPVIFR